MRPESMAGVARVPGKLGSGPPRSDGWDQRIFPVSASKAVRTSLPSLVGSFSTLTASLGAGAAAAGAGAAEGGGGAGDSGFLLALGASPGAPGAGLVVG